MTDSTLTSNECATDPLSDLDEFQRSLAANQGFIPIGDGDPEWKVSDHITILVYRINGRFDNPCNRRPAVWRRPIRYKGKWCIRDHGLVPLRGKLPGNGYVT